MPANFNPINGRVNYIPPDNEHRQHPELARHRCSASCGSQFVVDVAYVGNRSRNLMILGDFNQARPNAAGENVAAAGAPADPGLSVHPGGVRRRQGRLPRAAGQGRAPLHARALPAQLVHLVAGARQRVGPSRDGQRRQQPRQLRRHRRRLRPVGLQPAAEQHDDGGVGAAVRPRSPLGEQPARRCSRASLGGWRLTAINTMASGLPVNLTYSPARGLQRQRARRPTGRTCPATSTRRTASRASPTGSTRPTSSIPTDVSAAVRQRAAQRGARAGALRRSTSGLHKGVRAGRQQPRSSSASRRSTC